MDWKKLFAPDIASQGRDIYDNDEVTLIAKDKNRNGSDLYTANVYDFKDDDTYTVQIIDNGKSMPPSLYCSCDEFHIYGRRCKHLAAVFSMIDGMSHKGKKKQSETECIPADKAFPSTISPDNDKLPAYQRRYDYISVPRACSSMKIRKSDYERAQSMVNDAQIGIDTVEMTLIRMMNAKAGEEDPKAVVATAVYHDPGDKGIFRSGQKIKVILTRDSLASASCGVYGCSMYDPYMSTYYLMPPGRNTTLCEHVIATLILLNEYLQNHPYAVDSTDRTGASFLRSFANTSVVNEEKIKKNVILKPRIRIEQKSVGDFFGSRWIRRTVPQIAIDFRIGTDRLYVVKSLTELVEKYRSKDVLKLGKSASILFSAQDFTDTSKKYFDFIVSYIEEESYRDSLTDGEALQTTKELVLYGKRLDDLFDMIYGQHVDAFTRDYKDEIRSPLEAADRTLQIKLTAIPHYDSDGNFDGIRLTGFVPSVFNGIDHAYYLSGGLFARITRENEKALRPFIEASDDGDIEFMIGRNNLADFYYHVLPQVSKYVELSEDGDDVIAEYLPPEAEFGFFLDAEEDDVLCDVKAVYGDYSYSLSDQNEKVNADNFYRDIDKENQIIDVVNRFFPDYDAKSGRFSCDKDADTVYNIITEGVNSLMKLGDVNTSDQFNRLTVKTGWHLSVGVSVRSDLLSLDVLSSDIPLDELADVLDSYRRKRKYHRLKNGDFLSFEDNDSVAALEQMMEDMHVSVQEFTNGKMEVPAYRALYLNRMLEEHDEIASDRDRNFKSLIKNFKTCKDADYEVPASLKNVLRNYQKEGFRWLLTLAGYSFGGILADEMGLGKTLQMISALLYEKENGRLERSLIVCPASLVYNWQSEFSNFAPAMDVIPVDGPKSNRKKIIAGDKGDVLITSYETLRRDIDLYEPKHFGYMVLDEAQYIKNPKAGTSKAVKIVKASHRFALTGTPIENRLSELWSIFDFLMPGFLYDYETFRTSYESPIVNNKDEELTKRLSAMTSPFILRRKKESVLKDLPDKIEEIKYTVFDPAQKKLYDSQLVRMKNLINMTSQEDFNKNRMKILADITRLRQICCDPSLIVEDYKGGSAKRELLMELIEEAMDGGHKMLVFSQFTSMLELIQADLDEKGIPYYLITGATPKKKRLDLVSAFNENDIPVFLISLKAGGTGLNLIGADVVIHYDPWWNAAAENQATDRAHRIGQKSKVSVYKLIVRDTIEEKIVKMQQEKQDLADEILNGEGTSFFNLSKDELLDLLQ